MRSSSTPVTNTASYSSPLAGVHGHERDSAGCVGEVIGIRDERHLGEEVEEGAVGVVPGELPGDGHELVEVLDARLVLWVLRHAQGVQVAALVEQKGEALGDRGRGRRLARGGQHDGRRLDEDGVELRDRGLDLGADAQRRRVGERVAEGDVLIGGVAGDGGLGDVADAAARLVQDAADAQLVGGVGDRDEVGHRVFDLGTVVELGAAHDLVGNGGTDEDLFQRAGLRIGAVEHGHLAVGQAGAVQRFDLVGDELGLVVLRVAGETDDLVSGAEVGPELLVLAVEVVADDGVGRGQDVLRRAVVLLE